MLGYAFYACAFACAGALVPRLEELQSTTTPLTMVILVSLFIAFAVNSNPDGTLAHVTAFIPTTAPMTLPPRILLGEAPAAEIIGGALVTLAAAAALIPLAARIYSGAVLRTGSAVKLRDAWRPRGRSPSASAGRLVRPPPARRPPHLARPPRLAGPPHLARPPGGAAAS